MVEQKQEHPALLLGSSSDGVVYHDHSHHTDDDKELNELLTKADAEGVKGTDQTFPVKLHQLLSSTGEDGYAHVVDWQQHGRAFIVKKHKEFVEEVLPCCFRQTKFASFQRQLNLYGFRRITTGRDKGAYYHELFLRGRSLLALKMQRTKIKGTGARKPSQPETGPDFYAMPFVFEKSSKKTSSTLASGSKIPAAAVSPSYAPVQAPLGNSIASRFTPRSPPSFKPTPSSSLSGGSLLGMRMVNENQRMTNASRQEIIDEMLANSASMQQGLASLDRFGAGSGDNSNRRMSAFLGLQYPGNPSFLRSSGGATSLALDHNPLGFQHSLLTSGTSSIHGSSQRGPLHLNALGMACTCAIPAF